MICQAIKCLNQVDLSKDVWLIGALLQLQSRPVALEGFESEERDMKETYRYCRNLTVLESRLRVVQRGDDPHEDAEAGNLDYDGGLGQEGGLQESLPMAPADAVGSA